MFESICLSIRITCKANPDAVGSFEEALFMVFTEILQNDVQGKFKSVSACALSAVIDCHGLCCGRFFFCSTGNSSENTGCSQS